MPLWGESNTRALVPGTVLTMAGVADGVKLAYGHVFVLLAGASAHLVGHPDGARLIAQATEVIEARYWDEDHGLLRDEYARDWTPFSTYRASDGFFVIAAGNDALFAALAGDNERIAQRHVDAGIDTQSSARHMPSGFSVQPVTFSASAGLIQRPS